MQGVLKERCKLVIHEQLTQSAEIELIIGKKGPKMKETLPGVSHPEGMKLPGGAVMVFEKSNGMDDKYHWYGATMEDLAGFLSKTSLRTVHDMTGLTGRYDFTLQEVDEPSSDVGEMYLNIPINQLGLKFRPGKGAALTIFIDHIEKPDAN
jgi:uncharacterized protein (TIGR03435 family)